MTRQQVIGALVVLIGFYAFRSGVTLDNLLPKPDDGTPIVNPVDASEYFPEPNDRLKNEIGEVKNSLVEFNNPEILLDIAYYYREFSSVVRRDGANAHIGTNEQFARYQELTLDLAFAGKEVPGIGSEIDSFLQEETGLEPDKAIDNRRVADRLEAIAWAAYSSIGAK